ncbi:MAG: alpha/beta hydrolase [Xanthomonadaceae bacterium]|nr:alpha/beta hydrolase [Xanthomonadaceae bacterium]MDE1884836.1 alpha/beta hydrolase [Xanthomonadaceae bacterium]MDE2083974.1 alpha/beta hydrolase [Xanthomonadaceae bacterium]
MAVHDIELTLPGQRFAARTWGGESLPKLLALHGWLDNAASFDALAPLLCRHFHIVAIDFPGHGRSDWRPPGTWYHYVDYLSDALAAADALGWQRFGLLGHSLGAASASMLAGACPARVERLLLIEGLGPLTQAPEQTLGLLQRAFAERGAAADKSPRVFADLDDAVTARMRANELSRAAARMLVERGVRLIDGGLTWSTDPRLLLASPVRNTEEQVLSVLRGIRAPTGLILAEPEQPYMPRAVMDRRIAQVADIEVVRLVGTHHLHMENAAPVAAELLRFRAAII